MYIHIRRHKKHNKIKYHFQTQVNSSSFLTADGLYQSFCTVWKYSEFRLKTKRTQTLAGTTTTVTKNVCDVICTGLTLKTHSINSFLDCFL